MERSGGNVPSSSHSLHQNCQSQQPGKLLSAQQMGGQVLGFRNSKKKKAEGLRGAAKIAMLRKQAKQPLPMPKTESPKSAASTTDAQPVSYGELAASHIYVMYVLSPEEAVAAASADLQQLKELQKLDNPKYKRSKIRDHPPRFDSKSGTSAQRLQDTSFRWQQQLPEDGEVHSAMMLKLNSLFKCASHQTHSRSPTLAHTHTHTASAHICVAGSYKWNPSLESS
jgi:hypothetical protein